jgi:C-terminal processing protease CtpA/Prc
MKLTQNNVPANFSLDFPENNIALMKIRNFYPLSPKDDYKKFLKHSFLQIKTQKTEHLIIDLRDNEGGMDRWGALLYSYLTDKKFSYYKELRLSGINFSTGHHLQKPRFFGILKILVRKKDGNYYWTRHKNLKIQKPQHNSYSGNVYVLLNGNSYSVTAEFAAIAKSNNRALFFGQETGGAYEGNNSGTFAFVNLPNSSLTLAIPMLAYYLDVKPVNPMDRGILPDYYIPPVLNEKNNEPDFVIDFIRNMKNNPDHLQHSNLRLNTVSPKNN